jgi:hypothetical protein
MLIDIPPDRRDPLRQLFEGFPGLHGCLHAALEGTMGTARADDAARPTVAAIDLEFTFLAGDASAPEAEEAVRSVAPPAYVVTSNPAWEPLLRSVWGSALGKHTRVAFQEGVWDTGHLRDFVDALPDGYSVTKVTQESVERFAELADSLVYNFPSLDVYLKRGVGLGVEHEGRFVSGCSSFAISSHSLEFEIQTHADYRRRGLASAAAAAMILHCMERGLEACWDAHNEMSAGLATKLGFVDPAPYTSYQISE